MQNLDQLAEEIVGDLVSDGWLLTQQDFGRVIRVVSKTNAIARTPVIPDREFEPGYDAEAELVGWMNELRTARRNGRVTS